MSNHYHLVLKLGSTEGWSDDLVVDSWLTLHRGPILVRRYREGEELNRIQRQTVKDIVRIWRERLQDLSWFMKCLNEPIARKANAEDDCTGHFWESRFKSQALLTEQALLACMAYVDLNPVRANMAESPETSEYTSIEQRLNPSSREKIRCALSRVRPELSTHPASPMLLPFQHSQVKRRKSCIPFSFEDYLHLLHWTGRIVRLDDRGVIPGHNPTLLHRFSIDREQWLSDSIRFEEVHFRRFGKIA
jgi:hypothetical protein